MLDLRDGATLVKVSRIAVKKFFENQRIELQKTKNKKLNERHGVFVTIKKNSDKSLRGCIGFISPLPLYEGVQQAAVAAAFKDPRFPPLKKDELKNVIFEVSIMTEPTLVSGNLEELKKKIRIGRDGLIISNGPYSGLLLPQVWRETPNLSNFLEVLCRKAGLAYDYIFNKNTRLYKFRVQAFEEVEPDGDIIEVEQIS